MPSVGTICKMKMDFPFSCSPAEGFNKMPFLVVSKYGEQMEYIKRNETSGSQPSQRQHLFSAYEGSVMQDSPTLDEHYYNFAEDEDSTNDRKGRNRTQVISKYLHMGPYADESDMPRTILRVSQLCAWTIGDSKSNLLRASTSEEY